MRVGAVFPQLEIGTDPDAIARYARTLEELGYDHLVIFDHVLGADSSRPEGWTGTYDHRSLFHEPLVVYGYLAAVTKRLRLATAVLVLAQRQTALVAKQAAEVDVLSGGRVLLGVGIGWNKVEYQALGMRFTDRGKRIEEQIAVLRALWTQEVVDFKGRWHRMIARESIPCRSNGRFPSGWGAVGTVRNAPSPSPPYDASRSSLTAGSRISPRTKTVARGWRPSAASCGKPDVIPRVCPSKAGSPRLGAVRRSGSAASRPSLRWG